MRLVEIRDLDGPNIFLLQPAIKLELEVMESDLTSDAIAALAASLEPLAPSDDERAAGADGLGDLLLAACADLHERAGVEFPEMRWVEMETPGHWSLAFGWERRRFALGAARLLGAAAGLRKTIGAPLSPPDRAENERSVEAVRAALGEAAFAAAWAKGGTMELEQAIRYALEAQPHP